MKISPVVLAAIVLTVACNVDAADRKKELTKSPKKSDQAAKKQQVTGSRIERVTEGRNWTPDTDLTVTVIDRKQLDLTCAASTLEALRKTPSFR